MEVQQVKALLGAQKSRLESLNQFYDSSEKDCVRARETNKEYFTEKLSTLECWWIDFEKNDNKLKAFEKMGQSNMDNGMFGEASAAYKCIRNEIQEDLLAFQELSRVKTSNKKMAKKKSASAISTAFSTEVEASSTEKVSSIFDHDNGENVQRQQQQRKRTESESSESDSENDNARETQSNVLAEVKAFELRYDEMKKAIIQTEKLAMNSSNGLANVLAENLKIIWNKFGRALRAYSISVNNAYCWNMNIDNWQNRYMFVCKQLNDIGKCQFNGDDIELPKITLPQFNEKPTAM